MIALIIAAALIAQTNAPVVTRAPARAPEPAVEREPFADAEPDAVTRGRSTTVVVKGLDVDSLKTLQVSPPDGVQLGPVTVLPARSDGSIAVSVPITVDRTAQPGERTLMLTYTPKIAVSIGTRPGDPQNAAIEKAFEQILKQQTKPYS